MVSSFNFLRITFTYVIHQLYDCIHKFYFFFFFFFVLLLNHGRSFRVCVFFFFSFLFIASWFAASYQKKKNYEQEFSSEIKCFVRSLFTAKNMATNWNEKEIITTTTTKKVYTHESHVVLISLVYLAFGKIRKIAVCC